MKISELIGPALDWAVETLEIARMRAEGEYVKQWWVDEKQTDPSPYATEWSQGGPIIERELINTVPTWNGVVAGWEASGCRGHFHIAGPTPLIAAMRCYVSSKLGDDIEIPKALCES